MKKMLSLIIVLSIIMSCVSMISFAVNLEEANAVTVTNGDVENGTDGWYTFRGGSYEVKQPGADGTGNCMYFQPEQRWSTIGFDLGPAIIQDAELGYYGHGAGTYFVTFKAKAEEAADGYFAMILQSMNHLWGDDVADILGLDYYLYDNKTFVFAGDIPEWQEVPVVLNEEWTEYTVKFKVTQEWLDIITALRHTPENNPEYEQTYKLLLRFDGSVDVFNNGFVNYFVDDVSVAYLADEAAPTETPEATATPEETPEATATPEVTPEATAKPVYGWEETLHIDFEEQQDIDENIFLQNGSAGKTGVMELVDNGYSGNGAQYSGGSASWYAPSLSADATEIGFDEPGTYRVEFYINYTAIESQPHISWILRHANDDIEYDVNNSFRYLASGLAYELEDGADIQENKWYFVSTTFTLTENDFNANLDGQRTRVCLDHVGYMGNVFVMDELKVYKKTQLTGTIAGATVDIGSTLTINYFADAPEDAKMKFTSSSGKAIEVNGVYDDETGYYKFAYKGINPQCMNDTIKAELVYDDYVFDTKESYSVKAYCENQISKSASDLGLTETQYNALKTLLADMLVYGSEAQKYKDYNVSELPDASEWVSEYKSTFTAPNGVKKVTGNADAENKVKSVGLNMANVNRIYFKLILNDENVVIKLNDKVIDRAELIENADGTFILYSSDIKATGFNNVYTLTLTQGEEVISTVKYNVNAYIQSKNADATVGNIVKALSNYGKSAVAYAAALKNIMDNDFDLEEDIL